MRRLLITGTDTGVGKTWLTVGLLRAMRARALGPWVIKPVETGCEDPSAPGDGLSLAAALGRPGSLDTIVPWRFRLAASPMTAAAREGVTLDEGEVLLKVLEASALGEPLLIEGSGGLMVPMTASLSYAELARLCDARVLIVARDALGTINHTRMTVMVARSYGLEVVGVLLNPTSEPRGVDLGHAEALRRVLDVPVLGTLGWGVDAATEVEALGLVDRVLGHPKIR